MDNDSLIYKKAFSSSLFSFLVRVGGGGGGDFLIEVGMDVRRVQNLGQAKFLQKT